MTKYWVYILESIKDKWTYTWHTNNLMRCFEQHNSGRMKSTNAHAPFRLAYFEEHKSRGDAVEREKFLKSGVGRTAKISLITKSHRD